jgi:hypothetical protein
MPVIPVANIARHGIVSDEPDHAQPPEAWTNARNVRFIDNKAVRFLGDAQVMEPPSVAPVHLLNVQVGAGSFWIYANAVGAGSKIYGYNSGAHADMSRAANYTANFAEDWNSTLFQGIPILNNGTDIPQYLVTISLATDFANLPNWPANLQAAVVRSYKNYLVALNTIAPGDVRPHRVLVSDSAEPGVLPTSWDETDPAVDALEFDLSDVNSGEIIDGMALRDMFVIYKSESTWIMRHIGGQLIMSFDTQLQTAGILAKRCVTPLTLPMNGTQIHFLNNGQDVGFFDGQNFTSVVDKKIRKFLNSDIDPQFYKASFVVDNPAQDEAWFCYPQNGMSTPNIALVWNYRRNTITFRDINAVYGATGVVELPSTTTYDSLSSSVTYDNVGAQQYQDAARRKLVLADQAHTHLLQADIGTDFNGTPFVATVERTALAIIGQDREGAPLLDYQQRRLVTRLWPKVTGGPVAVKFGGSPQIGTAPTYTTPVTFTPGQEFNFIDPPGDPLNVRLPALHFTLQPGAEISGYDVDIQPLGDN